MAAPGERGQCRSSAITTCLPHCFCDVSWLLCRAMQTDNFVAAQPQIKTDEEISRLGMDLGPPLPSETPKPPWRPKAAGTIAFFFGPLAGALVVAISLRRMRYQERAKKVLLLAAGISLVEAAILMFIPDAFGRLVGLVGEIAFLLVFPVFMQGEFNQWQAAHPDLKPSSAWTAIGWGVLGAVLFLVIALLLALFLPPF